MWNGSGMETGGQRKDDCTIAHFFKAFWRLDLHLVLRYNR